MPELPPGLRDRADYVRALYQMGLQYPAWSPDRAAYHAESMWQFCKNFLPKPLPYKPFHREWMEIATGQQYFCLLAPRDHCLAGETRVTLTSGELRRVDALQPGDQVWGLEGEKLAPVQVVKAWPSGVRPVVRLRLQEGRELVATPNHRFLTWQGWKRVDELRVGDRLAAPRRYPAPINPVSLSDAEAGLLGYLIGDGYVGWKTGINFTNENPAIVADFRACVEALGWQVRPQTSRQPDGIQWRITADFSRAPRQWLARHGLAGKRAGDKVVPPAVFTAPLAQQAQFLSRLFACDGWASLAGNGVVGYASKSRQLIDDVQALLLRFGVFGTVYCNPVNGVDYWGLQVCDAASILRFIERIGILGKEAACDRLRVSVQARSQASGRGDVFPVEWRAMLKHSPHWFRANHSLRVDTTRYETTRRKVELAATLDDNPALLARAQGDLRWLQIVALEPEGPVATYDVEVTGDHAFMANDVVSHNSKSTSLGAAYPLWRLYMDPSATFMLVSSSTSVAELQLRVVKENLEANDLLRYGFGSLVPENPVKWTNIEIVVNRPPGIGHPSVIALGVGTAILSRRAKFIIADDIVRDDEVYTQAQRERLAGWITGVLLGVLEAADQIGFIGTKKHWDDYYGELELNPRYYFKRYDAIVKEYPDGTWDTLWPEKWPDMRLKERLQLLGSFQFNQNYRNITLSEGDSPFPMKWLERCKAHDLTLQWAYPYDDLRKVIGVDLASGSERGSYFCAITLGLTPAGEFIVLNIARERIEFPDQVRTLKKLIEDFRPEAVVIESNAYQGAMVTTIRAECPGLEIVPHFTGRNKYDPREGIPMMQPLVEKGQIRFPYKTTVEQTQVDVAFEELNRLGVAKYSDTVMALMFGVKYLAQFVRNYGRTTRVAVL